MSELKRQLFQIRDRITQQDEADRQLMKWFSQFTMKKDPDGTIRLVPKTKKEGLG